MEKGTFLALSARFWKENEQRHQPWGRWQGVRSPRPSWAVGAAPRHHRGEAVVGTRENKIVLYSISTPATCVRHLWVIQGLVEAGAA